MAIQKVSTSIDKTMERVQQISEELKMQELHLIRQINAERVRRINEALAKRQRQNALIQDAYNALEKAKQQNNIRQAENLMDMLEVYLDLDCEI